MEQKEKITNYFEKNGHPAKGRHWYNDGEHNYYVKAEEAEGLTVGKLVGEYVKENQEDLEGEIWRPTQFEGYGVSNMGRVRSPKRVLHPSGEYYKVVNIKKKTLYVHRLVAEAFLGSSELEIDHINRDIHDNRVENLRYVTRAGNIQNRDNDSWCQLMVRKRAAKSEEAKKKISDSLKGHEMPEETRKKLSEANSGKHVSDMTKLKMSLAQQARRAKEREQYE